MRQILCDLKRGVTDVVDVPPPSLRPDHLLIATRRTLISPGTERMLHAFGRAGYLEKARQQPDKVKQVLRKARSDGLIATVDAVRAKLQAPLPLGYCHVGTVTAVGEGVSGFAVGDRVVSNGPHAEVVLVPKTLCAKIPAAVTDDEAAFTVLAAIALHGVRLTQPSLGEDFAVFGLGPIGLLTVQLLRAQGCAVLAIDGDPHKVALAREFGAHAISRSDDLLGAAQTLTEGRGVDGAILAVSTASRTPMTQAAQICRKRGRIVLIGQAGLTLARDDFYQKELSFQVSCAYGPGRHDPAYEVQAQDYPLAYVRWTAQRNFSAVLRLLAEGRLQTAALVSQRYAIADAAQAYDALADDLSCLGVIITYPGGVDPTPPITQPALSAPGVMRDALHAPRSARAQPGPAGAAAPLVGVIGAGAHALRTLLPALKRTGVRCQTIASRSGPACAHAGNKFGFRHTATTPDAVIDDPEIRAVFILTRHDTHAALAIRALRAGKHVFVEKPLARDAAELDAVVETCNALAAAGPAPLLMVGFNRRFAPLVKTMHALLTQVTAPKTLVLTVNAGALPPDHWTQDPAVGGGRMVGEGCHFIDLLRFLVGHPVSGVQRSVLGTAATAAPRDTLTVTLSFADGSLGTVHYLTQGDRAFPKERLEVFTAGRVLQLDNFRRLSGYGWPRFAAQRLLRQDKGHSACVAAFVDAVRRGGASPIPLSELIEVSRVTLALAEHGEAR